MSCLWPLGVLAIFGGASMLLLSAGVYHVARSFDDESAGLSRVKSLLFTDVDWDELEHLDKPCPRCKSETLYRENGRLVVVDRCRNCRFEGATSR